MLPIPVPSLDCKQDPESAPPALQPGRVHGGDDHLHNDVYIHVKVN